MRLILRNGTDLEVERPSGFIYSETKGFHHFRILKVNIINEDKYLSDILIGKRVAIPLSDIKYLIIK
jgi:hypothetical protein